MNVLWLREREKGAWEMAHSERKQLLLQLGLQSSCSKAMVLKRPAPAEQGQGMARIHVLLVLLGLLAWDVRKGVLGLSRWGGVLSFFKSAQKGKFQKPT